MARITEKIVEPSRIEADSVFKIKIKVDDVLANKRKLVTENLRKILTEDGKNIRTEWGD